MQDIAHREERQDIVGEDLNRKVSNARHRVDILEIVVVEDKMR